MHGISEIGYGIRTNIDYVFRISISTGAVEILMCRLILSGTESNLKTIMEVRR